MNCYRLARLCNNENSTALMKYRETLHKCNYECRTLAIFREVELFEFSILIFTDFHYNSNSFVHGSVKLL